MDAMRAGFELFDHTADVGIRAFAPTVEGLVEQASAGLYAVIGELRPAGESRRRSFDLRNGDRAELLRDFLTELLILFEHDHAVAVTLSVLTYVDGHLSLDAEIRTVDEKASALFKEVKAITYHELAVRPVEDGFEAVLIVDI